MLFLRHFCPILVSADYTPLLGSYGTVDGTMGDIKNPPVLFFITVYWRIDNLGRYLVIARLLIRQLQNNCEQKTFQSQTRLWNALAL